MLLNTPFNVASSFQHFGGAGFGHACIEQVGNCRLPEVIALKANPTARLFRDFPERCPFFSSARDWRMEAAQLGRVTQIKGSALTGTENVRLDSLDLTKRKNIRSRFLSNRR